MSESMFSHHLPFFNLVAVNCYLELSHERERERERKLKWCIGGESADQIERRNG